MNTIVIVEVVSTVSVTVDKSKFTPEFLEEFKQNFQVLHTVGDHIEHLAMLVASGHIGPFTEQVEGYGRLDDMGIRLKVIDVESEALR